MNWRTILDFLLPVERRDKLRVFLYGLAAGLILCAGLVLKGCFER